MTAASWDPKQYLRFAGERARPCLDLIAGISMPDVRRAIDLGCGPGNSTALLSERWPNAQITGLDNSSEMIAAASSARPAISWLLEDIAKWAAATDEKFDLVFSNAALQWVHSHAELFPRLMDRIRPGGALAFQVPCNYDGIAHHLMRDIAASPEWRKVFPEAGVREWHVHDAGFYYDVLAPYAEHVDIWETEYIHVMPDAAAIVEWYKGTGMRPFLDALKSGEDRERFIAEYRDRIQRAYPERRNGRVLFPFRRLFAVVDVS